MIEKIVDANLSWCYDFIKYKLTYWINDISGATGPPEVSLNALIVRAGRPLSVYNDWMRVEATRGVMDDEEEVGRIFD
ncbi:hypothetical protein [Paenibacillus harenae]|uniref:hypothetical protein n=1 Tax=Paenibacillus harenae TaxID=306543 RepID=UPI0027D8E790|nr:hypothetical protein [Paenibacillus harenae]